MPPREVAQNLGVSVPTLYRWCPPESEELPGLLSYFLIGNGGVQPHPQLDCFSAFCSPLFCWAFSGSLSCSFLISCIVITSFLSVSISLASFAFEAFDALFHTGQLLLQLVPVVLQAFLFLFGGKETAKSWTAPATTAGASCQSA